MVYGKTSEVLFESTLTLKTHYGKSDTSPIRKNLVNRVPHYQKPLHVGAASHPRTILAG